MGQRMTPVNLFILIFKKLQYCIKYILIIFVFGVALLGSNELLEYILVDDTSSYTRLTMHELYNQSENIDVLFLGSSHCYRSLDTNITDSIFEMNTFNAGTSSQSWDGSYALLVEAGKHNTLKKVYLEMYYEMAGDIYSERTQMTKTYIISDYMRPGINKMKYLINAGNSDQWINGFIPARREWYRLFDFTYLEGVHKRKSQKCYKDFSYIQPSEEEYYAGKGYVANTNCVGDSLFNSDTHFESAKRSFSEDDIKSLEKIVSYCKKKGIELVLFSAPMPDFRLLDSGDYDEYIDYVTQFAKEHKIRYYDFNLCKDPYFSYDIEMFKDTDHLNKLGAEQFSLLFSVFFTGKITDKELFYETYQDKIRFSDKIYGIICEQRELENSTIKVTVEVIHGDLANGNVRISGQRNSYEQEIGSKDSPEKMEIEITRNEKSNVCVAITSNSNAQNLDYLYYLEK